MSDNEPAISKEELLMSMRFAFEELIKNTLAGVGGDVATYASQLTQEFGRYLSKAIAGDAEAERNLTHLKAQVLLIAVKRELIVIRETMDKLQVIVENAAIFAAKVLIAAAL